MSRLPVPGKDEGTWGEILNDYLSQSLTETGQLSADTVNTAQLQDGSVTAPKLSSAVLETLTKANASVQTINGQAPDSLGDIVIPEGPQGEQGVPGQDGAPGVDGANGTDGVSVTVTLVAAADWPPPSDPDPLHWYVKVP